MHIAKIGEKREKTFNFSPFCGIMNYIKKKTNLIQMLDFTVFVHISKCIKIVQVKRRIPVINFSMFLHQEAPLYRDIEQGNFLPADELENLLEEKCLLEHLQVDGLKYDGFHDFVQFRVRGTFPEDREKMLRKVEEAIEKNKKEKPVFAVI